MIWFRELYELWKQDNSLVLALNDSTKMLEQTLDMFEESIQSLRFRDNGDLNLDVYAKDKIVNDYIRQVRRKVLKYLAVTGGMNIIPGLVLTSIVIDIERIGDYAKNIMDMAVAHPERMKGGKFAADFDKLESTVSDTFRKLLVILRKSDERGAAELLEKEYWVLKRCDEMVDELIKEDAAPMSTRVAVSSAMYARYLKRIQAHLLNIASAIVNPFEHIGFRSTSNTEEEM